MASFFDLEVVVGRCLDGHPERGLEGTLHRSFDTIQRTRNRELVVETEVYEREVHEIRPLTPCAGRHRNRVTHFGGCGAEPGLTGHDEAHLVTLGGRGMRQLEANPSHAQVSELIGPLPIVAEASYEESGQNTRTVSSFISRVHHVG